MLSWPLLASQEPALAESLQALLYQHGVGLAFLGTVRPDGGPRMHPMCPVLDDDGSGLFGFIVPSPKQRDLIRDGRYALHAFPCPDNEDAAYLTGRAMLVEAADVRERLADQFVRERAQFQVPRPEPKDLLFEFHVESAMHTTTTGHGDPQPHHSIWRG